MRIQSVACEAKEAAQKADKHAQDAKRQAEMDENVAKKYAVAAKKAQEAHRAALIVQESAKDMLRLVLVAQEKAQNALDVDQINQRLLQISQRADIQKSVQETHEIAMSCVRRAQEIAEKTQRDIRDAQTF